MGNNELSRRSFLSMTLMGCLSVCGISLLASCQKKPEMEKQKEAEMAEGKSSSAESCTDISGLTDEEKKTRIANHYVDDSTMEGKECDNCSFFSQPVAGNPCGTCQIVKGPIDPDGYCTAWVVNGA